MEDLNTHFSKILVIKLLADKFKVSPKVFVLVLIGLAFILSTIKMIGNLVVLLTGTIYPALMSLNSIHSKEIDDDKQWLTYWVLFAVCNFFDYALEWTIGYIQFYYTVKLGVVLYLFFPSTKGSMDIYERRVFPWLLSNKSMNLSVGSRGSAESYKND